MLSQCFKMLVRRYFGWISETFTQLDCFLKRETELVTFVSFVSLLKLQNTFLFMLPLSAWKRGLKWMLKEELNISCFVLSHFCRCSWILPTGSLLYALWMIGRFGLIRAATAANQLVLRRILG